MRKRFRGNSPISMSQEIEADASGVSYQLYSGAPAFTAVKGMSILVSLDDVVGQSGVCPRESGCQKSVCLLIADVIDVATDGREDERAAMEQAKLDAEEGSEKR